MVSKSIIALSILLLFVTCNASALETSAHWRSRYNRCGFRWRGCRHGRICVKARWYNLCVRPMELGQRCGTHYSKVCAADAKCIKNRCSKIMPLGGQCTDLYWICTKDTTCNGKICTKTVGVGEKCEAKGLVCESGLECTGVLGKKVCGKPVIPLGGSCEALGSVCETGLNCTAGVCSKTVGAGEKCEGAGISCETDLSCVGTVGLKVCKKLIDLGGQCSDPYWVCNDGLTCNGKICTKVVGYRAKCSLPTIVCEPGKGLACIGTHRGYYCLKLMGEGGSCIDPWWRCRANLVCKKVWHRKLCRRY